VVEFHEFSYSIVRPKRSVPSVVSSSYRQAGRQSSVASNLTCIPLVVSRVVLRTDRIRVDGDDLIWVRVVSNLTRCVGRQVESRVDENVG